MVADDFLPPVTARLAIDIDDFLSGLDRAKAALTSFAAEADAIGDIKLRVEADTDGLAEQVRAAAAEASAAGISIELTPDATGLAEEVDAAVEQAQAGEEIDVPVKAEADALREQVTRATEEAKAGQEITVPVKAEAIDLDRLQETGEKITIPVEIDADGLREKTDAAVAEAEAGQEITVPVHVDSDGARTEGERAGAAAGDGLVNAFKARTIDINPGGGVFRIPVELIIPAIADLGQLTGILGLIPALFAGAATAAGTFAVGINDVSDAEKAYQAIEKQTDEQATKTAATYAQQLSTANSIINAQNAVTDATQAYADAQRKASEDVAKAQRDVQNATQSLAAAQRTTANDIINATQAVARAKQDEARAEQTAAQNNENALRAEQRAEEQLSNAQMAATRAQLALTDAREAASRSIEDLQHRVADDALSVQAATLNIQQAQVDLNRTLIDPTATQLQREQAQLSYQQQIQQLSDIQLQYQRAQEDAAKAAAAGVDGSRQVINAQDSLTQAQQRVQDATTAVGEAQEKIVTTQQAGAQAIADAQQKVADSERALTNAQIDGAERVQKAHQALADAEQKLNDTRISSTESVSKALEQEESAQRALNVALAQQKAQVEANTSAQAAYQVALDKLAPSARDALTAFNDLAGADSPFEDLHLDVQQRMFAGLGDEIRRIGDVDLPVLRGGMDTMADAINHAAHNVADFLTAPSSASDWATIFANVGLAADNLAGSVKPILQIITDLVEVGSEFLPGLADDFTHGAQSVADFVRNARDTGKLREWIQEGIDTFRTLWGIVKDLGVILKAVFANPGGDFGLLTLVKGLLDPLSWIIGHAPILITLLEAIFIYNRVKLFATSVAETVVSIARFGGALAGTIGTVTTWAGQWIFRFGTVAAAATADAARTAAAWVAAGARMAAEAVAKTVLWAAALALQFTRTAAAAVLYAGQVVGTWIAATASMLADQAVKGAAWLASWIATGVAAAASSIAEAAVAAAAWIAANAAIILATGGIILVIGAVILAGYELIKHWDDVKRIAGEVWNAIADAARHGAAMFMDGLRQIGSAFRVVYDALSNVGNDIQHFFTVTIPGWFTGAANYLYTAGIDFIIGFWNGFASWTGEMWNRILGWLNTIWNGIKHFFGISSPSTLAAEAGQSIAEGLAVGIDNHAHLAATAATNMAQQVSGALSDVKAPSFDFANTVPFVPDVGALSGGNVSLALGGAPAPLAVNASGQGGQPPVIQVTVQGNVWTEQELFSRLQTLTQQHSNRNPATGFVQYGFGTGR